MFAQHHVILISLLIRGVVMVCDIPIPIAIPVHQAAVQVPTMKPVMNEKVIDIQ